MRYLLKRLLSACLVIISFAAKAQSPFTGLENLFTTPLNYVVRHTGTPPVIDGDITDKVWQQAEWTTQFQDIEGDLKPHPSLQTQVKMLWDDSCLYIAARIQEPQVWAYQQHHDDVVYRDNDFEVFIDTKNTTHQYFEIEVNALNTIFDLYLNKPYRDGGDGMASWDAEGLRSAVSIQGTLNNPTDTDKGWTVEMAIPFKAINARFDLRVPHEGTIWRINFSRVEWDTKVVNGKYVKLTDTAGNVKPEHNWVWSPQGVIDMHRPERWGYLQFTKNVNGNITFSLPYAEQQKRYLWLIYYREKLWYRQHNSYLLKLKKLGLKKDVVVDNKPNTLKLEATCHQFMGVITDKQSGTTLTINTEGLVQQLINRNNE